MKYLWLSDAPLFNTSIGLGLLCAMAFLALFGLLLWSWTAKVRPADADKVPNYINCDDEGFNWNGHMYGSLWRIFY